MSLKIRWARSLWILALIACMGLLQQSQASKPKKDEAAKNGARAATAPAANLLQTPAAITGNPKSYPFKFAAYGDIRFTDPKNHHDTDPERRHAIIAQIAKDKPELVAISGDLVLDGGVANDWKVLDEETKPLRDAG